MQETIRGELAALTPSELRTPALPMSAALQEASDLLLLCRRGDVSERLRQVGMSADFDQVLEARLSAAREAQSAWTAARDKAKSSDLVELESEATQLRSDLIAAGRFNLAGKEAQATLSRIRGGDSAADLVQDLFDLSAVLENNASSFENDQTFDVAAMVQRTRSLAASLSTHVSEDRLESLPSGDLELRNRAFTHLDNMVMQVRAAGRYAFRREPKIARHFSSSYRRRFRGATRPGGSSPAEDVVEEAVVGEPTFSE